jgi:membrane-bound ClpP family serine protease
MVRAYRSILSDRKILNKIAPFTITLAVVLLAYFFPRGDKSIIIFAFLIIVFAIYKFDFRIPIGYGLSLLVITAVLISQKLEDSARHLAVLSYWILSASVIGLIFDYYRKRDLKFNAGKVEENPS